MKLQESKLLQSFWNALDNLFESALLKQKNKTKQCVKLYLEHEKVGWIL